jgi:uncharacterized membrane protein
MMVWNKGARFDMTRLLVPAFSFLIYYMGIVMSHTKRNWLFGVRTPWTLSSDKVWDETHRVASSLYKVSAIVSLLGLFGGNVIIFFLVPVLASSVFVVGYSYWFFTKTK